MAEIAKQQEEKVKIPEIMLNSGMKMPVMGFGTAPHSPSLTLEELVDIFMEAIQVGYRHFDTATIYGTEEALGKAVSKAIENGFVKNRDEFFITSKLYCNDAHPGLVLPALNNTLWKLGFEYLDLYLIHWPVRLKKDAHYFKFIKEDLLPFDIHGTWKDMEECRKLGLTKSIGVSNFTCHKLDLLLQKATIPPAVNQVEMSVVWQQRKLVPYCKEKGITISAWSPLGAYGTFWGNNDVKESNVLNLISSSKNKTFAQVALRWIYEQGAVPVVKSYNKERMRENVKIFDWELTKEESDQITKIPQHRGYLGEAFLGVQYKSAQDLWDGDL